MNATVTLTCNDQSVLNHVESGLTEETPVAVVNGSVYVEPLGPAPGAHTPPKKGSEALSVGRRIRDWRLNKRDRA